MKRSGPRPSPAQEPAPQRVAGRSLWQTLLGFILAFLALQGAWTACRDTWVERLVIHQATVRPAVAAIRLLTPQVLARPVQAAIEAPGGGLRILNGCEGTEIMFLLAAAFVAVPLSPRRWIPGLALGLTGIFLLNQARILILFYAFRADRALFDTLHTLVLPLLLVALVALYFYTVVHPARPEPR